MSGRDVPLEEIITRKEIRPTIVNERSKFVVVTYWWGRGNLNKNTSRPCQEFYERLLMKPFEVASYLDTDPDRIPTKFDWLKFIASAPGMADFYEKTAEKYVRESKRGSVASVKRSILAMVAQMIKENMAIMKSMQRIMYKQARLHEEFNEAREAEEDTGSIRRKILELVKDYKHVSASLKKNLRSYIPELERFMIFKEPVTYEAMIANWEAACRGAACNYMAVEYPEFTAPGGYQKAINAKPLFIQKALEACGSRAVVYIDGDMTINKYPNVFDMDDIDFMARGWNIDPRSSWKHQVGEFVVDPYLFETSGGIMYFSQSQEAKRLIAEWVRETVRPSNKGKADDRIISMIFNTKRLLAPMKIIQLPIEYLWLSMDYDYSIEAKNMNRGTIMVEHPECLTSEDTATSSGASSDRQPRFYSAIGEACPRSEELYESVMFPSKKVAEDFKPWLDYVNSITYDASYAPEDLVDEQPFYVYKWGDFGKREGILRKNLREARGERADGQGGLTEFTEGTLTIPGILGSLSAGNDVLYLPTVAGDSLEMVAYLRSLISDPARDRLEFIFADARPYIQRHCDAYQYVIDLKRPFFIRHGNALLFQLFALLADVREIPQMLQNKYQFLSRIRCHVLKRARALGGGGAMAVDTEEATNFLYGPIGLREPGKNRRRTVRRRRPQLR